MILMMDMIKMIKMTIMMITIIMTMTLMGIVIYIIQNVICNIYICRIQKVVYGGICTRDLDDNDSD